ncbi:MAG: DNA mismatch repair protein MutS, partial [Muribaculaceae bacterium]|nr:DNA mismatch repair protein MutS [Muribaculaceae bacterium]
MAKKIAETPLMKQYLEMKQRHPDAVLLFRVGDFYETFSDDAITASEILGITLTRRANGSASSVELAGFPHHALDTYLPKLVRAGKRVAICEQLEDPKLTKKLVKRGITELVTPGVAVNDSILQNRENNFLAAVHFNGNVAGVAFLDISTGEFLTAEGSVDYIDKLLGNFAPKEVLVERNNKKLFLERISGKYHLTELDDWIFTLQSANDRLLKHFETTSLKGFGVDSMKAAIVASGAVIHYLDITRHTQISHINRLARIEEDRYVRLDRFTIRNLELLGSMAGDEGRSFLSVIDRTTSPMGGRLLRRWITFPLKDISAINDRLDIVEYFFRHPDERTVIADTLADIGDLQRLISKVAVGRISPREVVQLKNAVAAIVPVKQLCQGADLDALRIIGEQLNLCESMVERINREIVENAPIALNRGEVIASGVNDELDELREIAYHGKDHLLKIQQRESEATGIPSLKIAYNNVFGYYLEVTNTHRDKVPSEWIRKQTLVNAERYITPELKELEDKIINAQERIGVLEEQLFRRLVSRLNEYIDAIQLNCNLLARLDCLAGFTLAATENHYNRPVVDDSLTLEMNEGRHPVIERQLPPGVPYITNSVKLEPGRAGGTQVMMITGPNMSGKSALLRSVALNVLMAQIGSFVAAESFRVGVVDKIFTRVGASDNISLGESTFMVEMNEAASILNNMSERSLILFDELGRGTSTYDGISIAWAIVEYITSSPLHPKTLFATHYHELNDMERNYPGVVNFNVAVQEADGKVVFLRKLERGGSAHSFGIHVAKLAGMPKSIVKRANEVLKTLEESAPTARAASTEAIKPAAPTQQTSDGYQLSFFQLDDPLLAQIRRRIIDLDINNLTPIDALNNLHE